MMGEKRGGKRKRDLVEVLEGEVDLGWRHILTKEDHVWLENRVW